MYVVDNQNNQYRKYNQYNNTNRYFHHYNQNVNIPISASTVTPLKRIDGKLSVLVGLRGVRGHWYKKLCTFGGSVDDGENPEIAGIREAWEEAGILIWEHDLKFFERYKKFAHYYCIYNHDPLVLGPSEEFEWEIYKPNPIRDNFSIEKEFGVNMIYNNGVNTGLAWVPVDSVLNSRADFVKTSPSTHILRNMRNQGII